MAGSSGSDGPDAALSSSSGSPSSDVRELEEFVYTDAKRRDIQLLLAAGVPQERISELTGVSVRTIRRIGREPASPGQPAPEL